MSPENLYGHNAASECDAQLLTPVRGTCRGLHSSRCFRACEKGVLLFPDQIEL